MIMSEKSISILLSSDPEGAFNSNVLEVWFKVARGYRNGAEIVIVTFGDDHDSVEEFMNTHADDGIRIAWVMASLPFNFVNVMKESQYYLDGDYIWYSPHYMYPNGDIMYDIEKHLNEHALYILKQIGIKNPFDYSTMSPRQIDPIEQVFDFPPIDIESFVVQARAFREIASIIKNEGVNGKAISRSLSDLLGIKSEYADKASVFVIEN